MSNRVSLIRRTACLTNETVKQTKHKRGNRRLFCTLRQCSGEIFAFAQKQKAGKHTVNANGFTGCAVASEPEKSAMEVRARAKQNAARVSNAAAPLETTYTHTIFLYPPAHSADTKNNCRKLAWLIRCAANQTNKNCKANKTQTTENRRFFEPFASAAMRFVRLRRNKKLENILQMPKVLLVAQLPQNQKKVQWSFEPVQNSMQLVFQTPPRRSRQPTRTPIFSILPHTQQIQKQCRKLAWLIRRTENQRNTTVKQYTQTRKSTFFGTFRQCSDEIFAFAQKQKVGKHTANAKGFAGCAVASKPEKSAMECRARAKQHAARVSDAAAPLAPTYTHTSF